MSTRRRGRSSLSDFLAAHLTTDVKGHPLLRGGDAIRLEAVLSRGPGIDNVDHCDYAPGAWVLELNAAPVVGRRAPSTDVRAGHRLRSRA